MISVKWVELSYNIFEMDETVESQVDKFFSQYRVRKYPAGQILILNGDGTDHIYNIVEGRVKQYDVTYRGDEIILNTFKPPAFFPMSLAINKSDNPYIYEAETAIEVRQAPAVDVLTFLKSNPEVLFDLLSRVYRGVDGLLGRMAHLMSSSAKGRLMFELLIECRRFGKISAEGKCILDINEKELGARAGLSRETVSREMTKLSDDKLVKFGAGKLTIFDVATFEEKLRKVI